MKKLILLVLVLVFTKVLYSQPVPPVKVVDCPAIDVVPVIDGMAEEGFWSPDQTLYIFNLSAAEDWTGKSDYDITFKMAWGWSYFYTLVTIVDDVDHSWNGEDGNSYEFDNMDFFFQLDTQTVPFTYSNNTAHIRFNRGDAGWASLESTMRNGITGADFPTFWENTADGWILECAIPWTNVMPEGSLPEDIYDWIEPGVLIGFDLHGTDSDGTDPLIGDRAHGTQTSWDEDGCDEQWNEQWNDVMLCSSESAWVNTRVFGYLTLIGDPVLETHEPIMGNDKPILYPNPASNRLHLSSTEKYSQLKIYSMEGRLVLDQKINGSSIDISTLEPGLYIAVFDNTDIFKFIKE